MAVSVLQPRPTVAEQAIEFRDIHLAVCRYRAQGLVCSTCADLAERAEGARACASAPMLYVPLAACLTPRSDAAVMVARLKHQLARLDVTDRAYVVDLVRRHIVAGEPVGA
jgi:hypothetical protein